MKKLFLLSIFFYGCATTEQNTKIDLKPLKSIRTFVRHFEQIKHEYELSLISGSEYNLIGQLENLYADMEGQVRIFDYNWQIITSRIGTYNRTPGFIQQPDEGGFLRQKITEYTNYASSFKDMRHNLSMLIEKLKTIKRLSDKWKLQKEREEKTLKALKVYSI